jgi:hypothetical protein
MTQLLKKLNCYIVTLLHCHIVTLSHCHIVKLLNEETVILHKTITV